MDAMEDRPALTWIALTCTLVTVGLSAHHTMYHYIMYRRGDIRPELQKCYVRTLLIAPIYSVCSWFALVLTEYAGVFDAVRGIYEAYVLYCFAALMLLYAGAGAGPCPRRGRVRRDPCCHAHRAPGRPRRPTGGEEKVLDHMESKPKGAEACVVCPGVPPCCLLHDRRRAFGLWKGLVLQFVIIKPICSILSAILEQYHLVLQADPYLKSVVVLSVTLAMVGLLNIYTSLGPRLVGLAPAIKFLVLKLAVFFTVWQEVVFHVLVGQGMVSPEQDWYCWWAGDHGGCRRDLPQRGVQTVACIVIFEMLAFTLLFTCVFSARDPALRRKYTREEDTLLGPMGWLCKMLMLWDVASIDVDDEEWDV